MPEALDQLDELLASLDQVLRQNDAAIHQTNASGRRQSGRRLAVRKTAFLLMTLVTTDVSAQQKPTTGYAPVNGINMYYEVHGGGEPVDVPRDITLAPDGEPLIQ